MNNVSYLCAAALLAVGGATYALPASAANATQQACSQQYQAAKSAGTLNGQKWPAFYSACAASIKSYQEPATAPAMPTVAAAPVARGASGTANVQANYQPPAGLSAGEAAFQQRIHACAAQWQSEKSAGTLPAGSKWPQFWSACNTQLKQQG